MAGAEVRLRVNWFFMCPNFYPESFLVHHSRLHLLNISQSSPLLPVSSIYLSSRCHAFPFFFSWIYFYPSPSPSLPPLHFIFPPAVGQCIFNPVSQPDLPLSKVQQGEVWYIICPILSRLRRAALRLVASQLIKPLVVWHPVVVGESDLAEWNKLTWPTAGWWMKWVTSQEKISLLTGLLYWFIWMLHNNIIYKAAHSSATCGYNLKSYQRHLKLSWICRAKVTHVGTFPLTADQSCWIAAHRGKSSSPSDWELRRRDWQDLFLE